jgi:hypothetical protein
MPGAPNKNEHSHVGDAFGYLLLGGGEYNRLTRQSNQPGRAPSQQVVAKVDLPPARKAGRIVGEGAGAVPALIEALKNEAKIL